MIDNIIIGQYVKSDSFIHKLDPRTKIILNIVYILGVFFIDDIKGYLAYFLIVFFVSFSSKIKIYHLLKALKTISMFIILTSLFNVFFIKEGNIIFNVGFLKIYDKALITSIFISFRVIFLILGSTILTLTTSPTELTDGFESLMKPLRKLKVPVGEISLMISISLRFIPTLLDETDKIIKAQKSRGVDFESGSIVKKIKNIVPILVPLFINSFRRADELAIAMESRCYQGSENRFKFRVLKFTRNDFISFIVFISLIVLTSFI
ncbi:energy-coupling factor transporter transmembrane component T family protein [Candidatus Arthromitus sp. SFB-turkey]|uniref:energy-coupling factor transporter transmembrane component T family protein n=1 Tax=Candidatus Arthromitus sp. SFB-turkey TaxID=1840217 RepID=UPI0007F3B299|nr:energy-coupling factor transporter transmembrane component T [Candidatus Arthromitus sp. SFB-turkey]OAT88822.1 transporter [Candidatus Arthromitus sp. SFB-turkey]HJD00885.1 energy-coupling factor transporter transmembrane protein EcfT [Candidatus Dwaynia gallinarum]HJF36032.1 energy-coupling factor transporter transmembrane protein EcfT [Clostridium perfringens]